MALPDLTGQNIQDTYQRVLQVGDDGFVRDGTGSLAPILYMTASYALSASVEITHEVSSSHAQRADFADAGNFISASSQIATEISGAFFAPSASFSTRVTANDAKVTNTDQSLVHLAVTGSNVLFGDITASGNISSSGTLYGTGLDILGPSNSHISVGEYNVGHDITNLEGLRITGSGLIISGAMADANHHNMLKIGNVELLDLNTNYGPGIVTSTGEFLIHNVGSLKITSGSDGGDVAGNAGRLLEHNGNGFIIYKNNIAKIFSAGTTTTIADTNIAINGANCSIRAVNDTPGYIMGFASNPNNAPGLVSSIAVGSLGELVGNLANPTITQATGEFGEGLLTINATSFAYNSSISFQRANVQGWKVGTGGAAVATSSFHIQGGSATTFTGDTTNGLYITSSNYNVGIGTQDPTEKLTVAGSINTTLHITASGNISASGNVIAPNLIADSASFSARVGLNDAKVTNSDQDLSALALTANISGSFFELSASLGARTADSERNIISLTTASGSLLNSIGMISIVTGSYAVTGSNVLFGDIAASGDVSASGDLYVDDIFINNVQVVEDALGEYIFGPQVGQGKTVKLQGDEITLIGGAVTASGNISASGNIIGPNLIANSASFSTRTTALEGNGVFTAAMISGSFFAPSASFSTRVTLNDAKVTNTDQSLVHLAVTGSNVLFGDITSSNDISASGYVYGDRGIFASRLQTPLWRNADISIHSDNGPVNFTDGNGSTATINCLSGDMTASGNISSSGHVYGQAGLLVYNTSSIAGTAQGDIIKFGDVPTIPGLIYAHTGSGWTLAHSGSNGHASSSLGLAVGSNSSADGMLLRGMANIGYEPGGLNGCALYLESPGSASNNVPSVSGDVARVIGWNFGGDTVYFTPDNTWVEIA